MKIYIYLPSQDKSANIFIIQIRLSAKCLGLPSLLSTYLCSCTQLDCFRMKYLIIAQVTHCTQQAQACSQRNPCRVQRRIEHLKVRLLNKSNNGYRIRGYCEKFTLTFIKCFSQLACITVHPPPVWPYSNFLPHSWSQGNILTNI